MVIDAHQHFWKYDIIKDAWIDDSMKMLQRDFLPLDLKPLLIANQIDGCIAVQADQSENETEFLLNLAKQNPFIKGVVGWVDLKSTNIESRLSYFQQFKTLKGFRHIVQAEPIDFMLNSDFRKGISLLEKYDFTYDILVFPHQLQNAIKMAESFPNQIFILDHLAKPNVKNGEMETWKTQIENIAKLENVYCKISGLATEADWENWQPSDLIPYIDVIVNAFGTKRVLFGSDWPVCLLATSYQKWFNLLQDYFKQYSQTDQQHFFGLNAIKCYGL